MDALRTELMRVARSGSRCILCDIVAGAPWVPFRSLFSAEDVASEVILESEHFIVIADIGPIVEGYALIVTKNHILSLACMEPKQLEEFAIVQEKIRSAQVLTYGSSISFEHGSGKENERSGACIDHAHMHVVPVHRDPSPEILGRFDFIQLEHLSQLCPHVDHPGYLYYEDSSGRKWGATPASVPRQFFRQVIRSTQAPHLPWDWRSFIAPSAAERTREAIVSARAQLVPLLGKDITPP
jgi:diadenosine tetraphosphate (Ap4A) HIT family hydrolase